MEAEDLEDLYLAASTPEIWKGHPSKDRYQREVFAPYAESLLRRGTTLVVIETRTDQIIGCSSYYVSPDQPNSIAIGFTFLQATYWGGATNFELKRLMLDHAFQSFDEVWFHIAPSNLRSQRATAKLGAEYVGDAVLDLSGVATEWMCYRLREETWNKTCIERATHIGKS